MSTHDRFRFKTLDELKAKIEELKLDIPCTEEIDILGTPVSFGKGTVPNRLGCHPMEGCDGHADGSPSDLTRRRYRRFGGGGAGLIWFEACAITKDSRANPRQLWLHEDVLDEFKNLVEITREAAQKSMDHNPFLVLQLTHSGRYSRPVKKPQPIIAHHSQILDPRHKLPPDYPLIGDEELIRLQDVYVEAAQLAEVAGFDAVDIKSCHRYLMNELFASHTREDSQFGGPYDNRVRMLLETVAKIHQAVPELQVTSRINVYDAIEYPYGWGVDKKDYRKPDLEEPLKLIGQLQELGYRGINVTIANPYFNPHYGRPFDDPVSGGYIPEEHPLEGVERLLHMARTVQQAYPDLTVVGTGYTWLRQFVPYFAAAMVKQGWNAIAGLGRGAFAYPDFARDIIKNGKMEGLKCCITCSSCTQIMRDDGRTGCVPRDPEIYMKIYKEGIWKNPAEVRRIASKCRECIEPTCAACCPAGIDIPAFLHAVADGEEHIAYRVLRKSNLLPEICAFVCPVEMQCQGHCIEQYLGDEPIPIARIQRYIAERALEEGWTALDVPDISSGKRVAVVGAGPAGLTCAAGLLERGHKVVILERTSHPGGKATSVIPHDRLPSKEADSEIDSIFSAVPKDRLEWRWNTALGMKYTLFDVLQDEFDAVVLAFGLGNSTSLAKRDENPEAVIEALAFLEQMNRNESYRVEGKIAVIGGGNTAIDAACMAKKRGADDVYVIYRRSFDEMPAWPGERQTAMDLGVHFIILTQPVGYEKDENGRLTAVRVVRTELGEPDESGRRRPVPVEGTEHSIRVSMAIEAIGEQLLPEAVKILHPVQLNDKGLVTIDEKTWMTSQPGVFASGDLVNGGTTVVQAIAEGREVAKSVDQYLKNK